MGHGDKVKGFLVLGRVRKLEVIFCQKLTGIYLLVTNGTGKFRACCCSNNVGVRVLR